MAVPYIAYKGDSFNKFLQWTDEKNVLGNKIIKLILEGYSTLFDIGAGSGDLTQKYADLFQEITLLEPVKTNCDILHKKFPKAKIIPARLEEYDLSNKRYDFIIASHVLMFVDQPYHYVISLYNSLNNRGRLIIILLDRNCGYLNFVDRFYPEIVESVPPEREKSRWFKVQEFLNTTSYHYEIMNESTYIKPPSIDAFLSLNDLHFNTDVSHLGSKTIEKMEEYLMRFQTSSGLQMDMKHKIFVIEKT